MGATIAVLLGSSPVEDEDVSDEPLAAGDDAVGGPKTVSVGGVVPAVDSGKAGGGDDEAVTWPSTGLNIL